MAAELLRQLLTPTVAVAAAFVVARQCRKPAWLPGRLVVRNMNARHSGVTDWGLGHVQVEKSFTILDVGCGGGRTIQKLAAAAPDGKVFGLDYAAASVAVARHTNKQAIEAGHVDIRHGSVSHMPYAHGTFDLVTAVETHYYWPDPLGDMREILRVLKPGGRLLIIAETYKGRRFDALYWPAMKLLGATYLTVAGHRELFAAAGYSEIEIVEEKRKGWICCVGKRPA
jgi:SAM-dependent methyltransferase